MAYEFAIRRERSSKPLFHVVARGWRNMMRELFDPYRPERHYMRGPGPKWRERHLGSNAGR